MEKIATDESLRTNLVKKGKERLQYFSWDKSAEKFWNIISNL
jgi:glycosyltransferase involved in cell wall biosynthesis